MTRQRSAVGTICFQGGSDCQKGWNTPERCWLRVVKSVCEDREETFPVGDEGHKKTRFSGLCSGLVYLPITGEYLPFSVSAFAPMLRMALELVGAPVLLCVACSLLCQLFNHIERVEHQLCHVDCARANPYHWGNNLLLHGRHAFTYLANFIDQVFTRCDCLAPDHLETALRFNPLATLSSGDKLATAVGNAP